MTTKQISGADPCALILSEFVSQKEHVYLTMKDKVHSRPRTKAITPEMDLPSTDTGYWRTDTHVFYFTVPAPDGWECNWHTTWNGIPADIYPKPTNKKNLRWLALSNRTFWRMRARGERFWKPLVKRKHKRTKVPVDYFSTGK